MWVQIGTSGPDIKQTEGAMSQKSKSPPDQARLLKALRFDVLTSCIMACVRLRQEDDLLLVMQAINESASVQSSRPGEQ